jgi:toxin YhaV
LIVSESGWVLLFDSHFESQYQKLLAKVERASHRLGDEVESSNHFKRFTALRKLVFEVIPADPAHKDFWLGNTLPNRYKSWRRARFLQQYRLFFRFDSASKTIIYSWFNDEETLRAYGKKSDAYFVFEKMLTRGKPPTDWDELRKALAK